MASRTLTVVEDGGLAGLLHARPPTPSGTPQRTAEILQVVRDLLLDTIPVELLDPVAPAADRNPEVLRVLRAAIGNQTEQGFGPLRDIPTDEDSLLALFRESLGWGPAQAYLDDPTIQEVKIIGDMIMVQEDGADFVMVPERFSDPKQALDRAVLLAGRLNVQLDRAHPQGTLPLAYGTRMHVTVPPCTPENTALICIRRGRQHAWVIDDVVRRRAFSPEVRDLLLLFARAKCSFLIAGETGSGKTALLEAIVNSWPGEPHIITIEDNVLEINVRHSAWTRELVQTASEPNAYGRAAKEVLRQTPSVVAPGETRAAEAGAILAVAVSGHAVITTLHAKSAMQAVQRFADCAAMPEAYSYAGRRDNALEDACDNIEVVIHIEKMGGRRYISEMVLLNGVDDRNGRLRPRVVPLVEMVVDDEGQMTWRCAARAEGDTLLWKSGKDLTPDGLAQKLRLLRAGGTVRSAPTTRTAIATAITQATQAMQAGNAAQALAILERAWADRRDASLLAAAQRTLEMDYYQFRAQHTDAEAQAQAIATAIQMRRWDAAQTRYQALQTSLPLVAAFTPAGGWEAIEQAIAKGMASERALADRIAQAQAAHAGGRSHDALALLGEVDPKPVSPTLALEALTLRREVVAALVQTNEASQAALDAIEAMIAACAADVAEGRMNHG